MSCSELTANEPLCLNQSRALASMTIHDRSERAVPTREKVARTERVERHENVTTQQTTPSLVQFKLAHIAASRAEAGERAEASHGLT
jgi:hypothetical protein